MVDSASPREGIDQAVARIAAKQHGNVTRAQLLEVGLADPTIRYRVKLGRLHRVFGGVYTVGHRPPSPLARAAAAVLACGDGAVLSHSSAAKLWGIDKRWSHPFEVTASNKRQRAGIRAHRSISLSPEDVTRQYGIPVTTPARTVFDLAPRLSRTRLSRAVNELRLNGYLTESALADLVDRFPTSSAAAKLRCHVQSGAPTRSVFEDAFLDFARRHDLPRPETNARVAGHEVDILFREQKLIVELDGYAYHDDRRSFERDRERDSDTLADGFATVRLTWVRMTRHEDREAARLKRILAQRTRISEALT